MYWKVEAAVQKLLSAVPGGGNIYFLGQRLAGGFRRFSVQSKVSQGQQLLDGLKRVSESVEGKTAVELGSGWTPIIPLLFWLHGQERAFTFDVVRLLRESLLTETVRQLARLSREGAFPAADPARIRLLNEAVTAEKDLNLDWLVQTCHIQYQAPILTRATGLAGGTADIVYSNAVLEHVPGPDIGPLLGEARRMLHPHGLMIHNIDLTDHFSHSDSGLSAVNYLRFSQEQFKRYNNPLLFQNRWRPHQYRQAILEQGFEIVLWEAQISPTILAQLEQGSLQLHSDYATLRNEEIATTQLLVVSYPG